MRIGGGAGTSDDRIMPAVELTRHGALDYLVFECLAERTIARENLARKKDPEKGYTPRLVERMELVLDDCLRQGVKIVTNMGAANPPGAARAVMRHARENGHKDLRCAVVAGDDVSETMRRMPQLKLMETGE